MKYEHTFEAGSSINFPSCPLIFQLTLELFIFYYNESYMLRRDNVSRRTDESDSKLVVTESLSLTDHDVYSKGNNKSSGECN